MLLKPCIYTGETPDINSPRKGNIRKEGNMKKKRKENPGCNAHQPQSKGCQTPNSLSILRSIQNPVSFVQKSKLSLFLLPLDNHLPRGNF
jgi:hypothetical protein